MLSKGNKQRQPRRQQQQKQNYLPCRYILLYIIHAAGEIVFLFIFISALYNIYRSFNGVKHIEEIISNGNHYYT